MTAATPITTPSTDQQVNYFSTQSSTPLAAVIVGIWADGPVDVVVTDPSVAEEFKVKRIPYVPFGGSFVPLNDYDTRYVAQIGLLSTDANGLPATFLQDTAATEGGNVALDSTEPLEN